MRILTVGKKHNPWVEQGIAMYQQRLRRPYTIEWIYLPHQPVASKALEDESQRLLQRCQAKDFVILLDETGRNLSSPQLSQILQTKLDTAQPLTLIIGGAYGVNDQVKARADLIWSLSALVFPHQLVRLLVTEQLYRAQSIALNEPYHHG